MIEIKLTMKGGMWGVEVSDSASTILNDGYFSSPERALKHALAAMERQFNNAGDGEAGFDTGHGWFGPEEWPDGKPAM